MRVYTRSNSPLRRKSPKEIGRQAATPPRTPKVKTRKAVGSVANKRSY